MRAVRSGCASHRHACCWLRSGLDVACGYAFGPRLPDALSSGRLAVPKARVQTVTLTMRRPFFITTP